LQKLGENGNEIFGRYNKNAGLEGAHTPQTGYVYWEIG